MSPFDATTLADTGMSATRLLDAPRDLVFRVFTDPMHLAEWWGPLGFTLTTRRAEMKPGGEWRFVMHGPDGRDYENLVTFLEVEKPARIVYKQGGIVDGEPVDFTVELRFEDDGGKTRLYWRTIFASRHALDFVVREHGAFEGLKQTLGRLAEHLALQDALVITRLLDAPRDVVWRAHTEIGHLKKWWGPKGFDIFHATQDLRPGGMFHYGMRTAAGQEMWGRFVYREILPQRRIVWVNSFSDPQGGLTRHVMSADWPLEMLIAMSFEEAGGKTTLTLRSAPINASDDERRVFKDGYKSMQGGFGGTYDRLDAHLAGAPR